MKRNDVFRRSIRDMINNAESILVLTPFGTCTLASLDLRSAIRMMRDGHMVAMAGRLGGSHE